ncbi:MAG: hypothetical protein Q8M16_10870 [Pirellulaceae bacterium]|nr:hypothetical protein [Pirellulaceae bacterium]
MGRSLRSEVFLASEVCIVHAVQRCVRRAFLAGVDEKTGRDYSHRKEWIRRRLEALASTLGVDVLTYAIMSNHLHVILRNRPDVVATWSDEEVATRWLKVFPGRRIEEQLAAPSETDVKALVSNPEQLLKIRERLSDISWFMRALAEPIARMANNQEKCTGRFWEGRFKAQRIVDETGLLACSMYVDLNPIRAAMAQSLEQALHTSAYDRLEGQRGQEIDSAAFDLVVLSNEEAGGFHKNKTLAQQKAELKKHGRHVNRKSGRRIRRDGWLAPLTLAKDVLSNDPQAHHDGLRASDRGFLRIEWTDYVSLLRWTAKDSSHDVDGTDHENAQNVLSRIGIDGDMWRDVVWNFKKYFGQSSCAGKTDAMAEHANQHGKRWRRGQRHLPSSLVAN